MMNEVVIAGLKVSLGQPALVGEGAGHYWFPFAADRLLYIYDRTPFGWKPVPVNSPERSRIYALPVRITL